MIRTSMIALAATLAVAACQPQKTPEQIQAEQTAAALQQMGAAFGANGQGQATPEQMAAAIAKAGAMASALDANMTPEERAKLQAISGALASGQVHPAASAYFDGANKTITLLSTVKDIAGLNAIRPQLTAVYSEMAAPAATLKAMTEDERDVAFGSAMSKMLDLNTSIGKLMSGLSYNSDTMQAVGEELDKMPQVD